MAVVQGIILWPVRTLLRRLERGCQERVFLRLHLARHDLYFSAFRQMDISGKDDDAVLDRSRKAHEQIYVLG